MSDQELARDLGFLEAYTIGLGTMIGAGIFVLPSLAAEQAGPASMVSFFIGGLISLLAALSLSELATGMPKAGGSYYYVNRALGPFFGSIVGLGMWAGLTFASAFYMIGFGQYLLPGLGEYLGFLSGHGEIGITVAALVMAAILTGVNYYGVKETGALQNVIVLTLVGLIVAFLSLGFIGGPQIGTFLPPEGWPAVAATVGTVYVTFIGFEVIATSAEEIKNPSRNLPLSMIAAVVTPTLMYVGVMYVSTGTLSIDALATSQVPVADVAKEITTPIAGLLSAIPFLEVSPSDAASGGAIFMIVGAVLATVSSANASILSAARVNFAMGRDRILTNWLNEVHDDFRTPYRAITATGIITLALIGIGVGIGTLAETASFMYLVTYALVHVGVVVLRRADPDNYDPDFQIPSVLYPIAPIVGALACVGVLFQMSIAWTPYAIPLVDVTVDLPLTPVGLIGSLIVLAGVLWYYGYARDRAPSQSLVGEALAPAETAVADGRGRYRVVVPVANPETERDLLEWAAASAHAHPDENAEVIAVNVIEVPQQTSLEQDLAFENERVERQQELLDSAEDIATDLNVGLRTHAIVARSASDAILDVVERESADQVLLGWSGSRSRREHVLGSNIDPIVERAPCETTLLKLARGDGAGSTGTEAAAGSDEPEELVVLAGEGPHAPVAARRAAEYARARGEDAVELTFLNVQPVGEDDDEADLIDAGEATIEEVVERAGVEDLEYESRVLTTDEDVRPFILEQVDEYDTVCVGATRTGAVSQALFGSIPEAIGERSEGRVVMARGPERSPRTVRDAIVERVAG
jgi:APA family basic amino acid/polyamine antiporter